MAAHVAQTGGTLLAEFQEVESGKRADRPQFAAALAACRTRRSVLLIAKLDHLARNARFLLSVVEGNGEAGVVFCDLPTVPAGADAPALSGMWWPSYGALRGGHHRAHYPARAQDAGRGSPSPLPSRPQPRNQTNQQAH